jgi:hypothetical protein
VTPKTDTVTSWFENIGALRAWAVSSRPVFVCGQERSGTSALQLALSQHPALFAVPHVYETFIFREPRNLLHDPPRQMLQAYLRGHDNLKLLRERLAVLAARAGGDLTTLDDDDLVRAFFAFAAQRVYHGQRPLEKTPAHVHSLARVFSVFPQARVLACVREPIEVVDSYRRRLEREQSLGKPREAWGWLEQTDEQLIQQFRRVDRALTEAAQQAPGQVFQVPYGWLNADPQAAMTAICKFIGEPFDPAVMSAKAAWRDRVDERLGKPIGTATVPRPSTLSEEAMAKVRKETWGLTHRWRIPGPLTPDSAAG